MSKIEWTEETLNPTVGCSKVSPECTNCYAIEMAHRLENMGKALKDKGKNIGRLAYYEGLTKEIGNRVEWTGKVSFVPEALEIPLKRKKPTVWFVNSMSDLFHETVTDEQIDQVFAVMAATPRHTYQILTKRPERMYEYCSSYTKEQLRRALFSMDFGLNVSIPLSLPVEVCPPRNIWLGVSAGNQKAADDRIPWLVRTPAAKRFLSCEPLLGEVVLCSDGVTLDFVKKENRSPNYEFLQDIDWVIVGAESGHNARPMNEDWVRSIRDQCIASNTAFFYKQNFVKGKKVSLPKLDGREWAEMPV